MNAFTLQEIATDCLNQVNGDRKRAAEMLYERLDDNQKAELLERYLDKAIWALLKKAGREVVPATHRSPASVTALALDIPETSMGLMRLAKANLDNLLDGYHLSSGIVLGNANRAQLLEEATREHGQASAHLERCLFLRAVANRIGSASKVRAVLHNDELRKLAASATQEVAQ